MQATRVQLSRGMPRGVTEGNERGPAWRGGVAKAPGMAVVWWKEGPGLAAVSPVTWIHTTDWTHRGCWTSKSQI